MGNDGVVALTKLEPIERFVDVSLAGVTSNCRVKKPAMLGCFELGLALEGAGRFGATRGVFISLPSMPRTMTNCCIDD